MNLVESKGSGSSRRNCLSRAATSLGLASFHAGEFDSDATTEELMLNVVSISYKKLEGRCSGKLLSTIP